MGSEFDRSDLVRVFVSETSEGLTTLAEALRLAADSSPAPHTLQEQYIIAHRIRGAAALYGYEGVSRVAEQLEGILERAVEQLPPDWPRVVAVMRETIEDLSALVALVGQGNEEDHRLVQQCLTSLDRLKESSITLSFAAVDYVKPSLDQEILSYFIPEAEEYLGVIDELLRILDHTPSDEEAIYRLFRATHTLKGSAYTVGFQVIGDVSRPMEECMIAVREKRLGVTPTLREVMTAAASLIRRILQEESAEVSKLQQEVPVLVQRLTQVCESATVVSAEGAVPPSMETADSGVGQNEAVINVELPVTDLSDDYLIPDLDPEVMSYFVPEAQEYLELLEADLLRLEKDPQDRELINQLFRTAHTLKGSAYTVGFRSIGDLVHHVEDFMGAVRDGRFSVLPGHTDLLLRTIDVVRVLMRRDPGMVIGTRERFSAARSELKRLDQGMPVESTMAQRPADLSAGADPSGSQREELHAHEKPQNARTAEDREVIRVSYARLERLMNLVGELVTGRSRLEQRLRVLEQLSQQVLVFKARLVDSVQSFGEKHTFTYRDAPSSSISVPVQAVPAFGDFGSLELDKYDDFNILARRIGEVTADISESMSQLDGSIRRAHEDMSHLQHLTLLMRDEISRARMVPIGTPFTRFRRAIREIARASNKEVSLVTSGEQTEVDTGVVERLVDPLIHLVRNAVYHGIEPAVDRVSRGKSAVGAVYLHAAHRGNSIIIEVEDDGAGLDLAKIRAKAVKMGLADSRQLQAMSDEDALQLIFLPGFSTAEKVGGQAGRGVGLDVVKRVIEEMNGQIEVESMPGLGTRFTLALPLTLLIATALLVRAGTERYAIPLLNIHEVTMPTASSMREVDGRTFLQVAEETIEVQSLFHVLRRESGPVEWTMPVVVVRTATGPMGLAVDTLLGRQEIVIKSLGLLRPLEHSLFGGATIDPEGRVILVIDPARLTPRETKDGGSPSVLTKAADRYEEVVSEGLGAPESQETRLLLVDDSLSIRKFVGKMLESAGYQVDTAVDGEDGLRKASATSYRMILTDLEMPKLNGFEVIQALRSRPETKQTPIVVMTTRAGDKHRQMALSIGANSYIAKPVEERMLLQEVERWAGRTSVPGR
jgi:chemosensory pili system protein ChpA (sensor histidine kinase/response regulator)